jgi:hypothetical protein
MSSCGKLSRPFVPVEEIQKARKDLRKAKENLANANSRLEQEWAKPRVNPKRQKSLKQEEERLRIALKALQQ